MIKLQNAQFVCITRQTYYQSDYSHTLAIIAPGNYSFRLRAFSLAGYGDFTEYKYFVIQVSFLFFIFKFLLCLIFFIF